MPGRTSIGVKIRDKVQDKVIAIKGGARGIGLATAAALHNLGAKVAIGDIDEAMAKESGADLDLDMYGKLDVTDPDSFRDSSTPSSANSARSTCWSTTPASCPWGGLSTNQTR